MASGHEKAPHQQAGHMAVPTSRASPPSKKPLPTGSRPHMAQSGLFERACRTSAFGKADTTCNGSADAFMSTRPHLRAPGLCRVAMHGRKVDAEAGSRRKHA